MERIRRRWDSGRARHPSSVPRVSRSEGGTANASGCRGTPLEWCELRKRAMIGQCYSNPSSWANRSAGAAGEGAGFGRASTVAMRAWSSAGGGVEEGTTSKRAGEMR